MATSFSMLGLMNAALTSQGYDEIVSENDGTPEFRVLARNWPSIVEAEMEDGAYSFAKTEATLLSRQAGKYGFEDSYLLPGDVLHVRRAWLIENGVRGASDDFVWVQDATSIHLDGEEGCIVEIVTAADPGVWSANFSRGVQFKLEAVIARSLKEETSDAMRLEAMALDHFQRARTLSSKQRSARPPTQPGRIALARFGRNA